MVRHSKLSGLLLVPIVLLLAACTGTTVDPKGFSLTESPLVGKIVWHDLMSDDLQAAQTFYGGLLGWNFEQTERFNGKPYVLARSGGRYVAGMVEVSDPQDGSEYSRWLGYLSVDDVEAAVKQTQEAGGVVVIAPREIGQIGTAAVIRDPQGAPIGLLRIRLGDPDDRHRGITGGVGWNELLASDPVSATMFYTTIAGYEARQISRFKGEYHVLSDGVQDRAGVFLNPLDGTEPTWLTHFVVEDLAMATRKVEELGGKVLLAPSPEFRGGRVALIQDPSGAALMLREDGPGRSRKDG